VAVAFTLIRLSRFNELSAILAAGVPLLRVSAPIIFASLGLNVLLFADQEALIPSMIPKLIRSHDEIQQGVSRFSKGFPIQAMQDADGSLLMASRFTPATAQEPVARMLDFDVIERDSQLQTTAHITADQADWDSLRKEWILTTWSTTDRTWGLASASLVFCLNNGAPMKFPGQRGGPTSRPKKWRSIAAMTTSNCSPPIGSTSF